MKRITFVLSLMCIILLANCNDSKHNTIKVAGKATIVLPAEYATIKISINKTTQSSDSSYKFVNMRADSIEKDLSNTFGDKIILNRTATRQNKNYNYENSRTSFKGYEASIDIKVIINDISRINEFYSIVSKVNEVYIGRTWFGRSDEAIVREKAFDKALKIAKRKAEVLAKSLDAKVGPVENITEISAVVEADFKLLN